MIKGLLQVSKKNERQGIKGFGIVLSLLGIVMMIAELWLADGFEGINYLTYLLFIFLGQHMVAFANACIVIEKIVQELQEIKGKC